MNPSIGYIGMLKAANPSVMILISKKLEILVNYIPILIVGKYAILNLLHIVVACSAHAKLLAQSPL